jgi:hypothetical protein
MNRNQITVEPEFSEWKLSRRGFLLSAASGIGGAVLTSKELRAGGFKKKEKKRPKVAAVFTTCTHRSHAHVILENFLEPYLFNGKLTDPGVDVVSFYADQLSDQDMTRSVSRQYNISLYKTIREALCLGGKELAVDAVLSIGEHGKYPYNELGQHEYPRKRFFDEITAVMKQSNRFVPLFNDKHLSYRWDWAKEMYDVTQKHGIPFMAGSSVPLAERVPSLELPQNAEIEEAVSIHSGGVESYDLHALEVLQSMVESRKGGETGISSVEFLDRQALMKALKNGRISKALVDASMEAEITRSIKPANRISIEDVPNPHAILLRYKDGFKATVIGNAQTTWNFACRLKNDPQIRATSYYVGPWNNRNLFKALSHAIQYHFTHGEAPYPVERTLLNTGVLDTAMHSRKQSGKRILTPHLEFFYAPRDFRAMREMGKSWKIITEDVPEPKGIRPNG